MFPHTVVCFLAVMRLYVHVFVCLSQRSVYLHLLVALFGDGVTQDIQEADILCWGRRVPEHLQPNRWGRSLREQTHILSHAYSHSLSGEQDESR